jgi:light-regulated signal transduction histidine kinase (bacteriophytochrome)
VNLSELAAEIAADLQRQAPDRVVDWVLAPGLTASGDPGLLRTVLENLIGNAWKFTSKLPRARIELGTREEEGRSVLFVRDNGAGFDMAHAAKLFGAFQRLHAVADFAGSGVGLASVKRIIHRHGGRVWAEGAPDLGATISFTLPQP